MRSSIQPFRRNSALYRVYDDLILYLKTELNFQDLSYYYQEVIEPSGLNLNIVPEDPSNDNPATHGGRYVPLPGYDTEQKTHSLISLHKTNVASVFFSGEAPDENGDMMSGQSIPVSGTGVYTTGPELDSASLFNLKDDFCIEFWAKFSGVPDSVSGSYLFDFGNLKLANHSGFFTIEAPDSPEKYFDWYDADFRTDVGVASAGPDGGPTMTNRFTHYAVQKKNDNIEFWVGPQKDDNTPGPFFKVLEAPFFSEGPNGSINKYMVSGNADEPFNNIRTFGSTISGTHPYTGWMDEIKVWKKWIYDGPVVIGPPIDCSGIYVNPQSYADMSVQGRINMLTQPFVYYYGPHYITDKNDALLFVQVDTRYDPRYSVHIPLPVEVRWYKNTIHQNNMIATSLDATMVQGNIEDKKFEIGTDGLYTLKIKGFSKLDQGVYRAVVIWGNPVRPIKINECGPVFLKWVPPPPPPCHAKDTDILMRNKKVKKIQDLRPGNWLIGFDENHNLVDNGVKEVEEKRAQNYYKLKINNKVTKVTGGHPYYIGKGKYQEVKDLKVGDTIYIYEEGKLIGAPVQSKKFIEEEIKVYTLSAGGTKNYFANKVAAHNKTPPPPIRITVTNCGTRWTPGTDVEVCATLSGLSLWNHTSPITWTWGIGGAVTTVADTDTTSCRTFRNLTRNTGGFTITATDANGQSWSVHCWGLYIDCPPLQCPEISDLLPNVDKTDDYAVYPQGPVTNGMGRYRCLAYRGISIHPDQPSIGITFEVNASDPNIAFLNTGGLRFEWWNGNAATGVGVQSMGNQWVQGTNKRTFTIYNSPGMYAGNYHGGSYVFKCRICYNNYLGAPTGGWGASTNPPTPPQPDLNPCDEPQEACTIAYFAVNFPHCKFPWVEWGGLFGGHINTNLHRHMAYLSRWQTGTFLPVTGGWARRNQAYYGRTFMSTYWRTALTNVDGVVANVFSCSEDTDTVMYVLADRNNPNFNTIFYGGSNCGSTSSHWQSNGLVHGGGYVHDDGVRPMKLPGAGHPGITVRQGGPNASANPATFSWQLYAEGTNPNGPKHGCFQPIMDRLIITKDVYDKDDGSFLELDFVNECGSITKRIDYRVYKETAAWLTFSYWTNWYWGGLRNSTTSLTFYRYLHIFSGGRFSTRTGAVTNYAIYWYPSADQVNFTWGPTSACMMWRLKLNGVNMEAADLYTIHTAQGFYHLGGGSKCGLMSRISGLVLAACAQSVQHGESTDINRRGTYGLSFNINHRGQGVIRVDARSAWESIGIAPSAWKRGTNTVELTICNNPPDGNPANILKGNCASHTIIVVLDDAPIIISPINSPFSGMFSTTTQSWWWRWWWPWYNPWFTGGVIRGLFRGRNGWWRWHWAIQRPGGSGQNGTRISLRVFAAMQGVTIP